MFSKFWSQSEFGKNVITLITGTSIAQAIPLIVTPILSRIYTPNEFGVFAMYIGIAMIASVLSTGRFELAILLPKRNEEAINLLALSLFLAILLSIFTLLVLPLIQPYLNVWTSKHEVIEWLYLLPVSILFMALHQTLNYWNNRKKAYKRLSYNKVVQSSSSAAFKLVYGKISMNSFGLIAGNIIGYVGSSTLFVYRFFKEDTTYLKVISISKMKEMGRRYIKFPKYDMPSGILNTSSSQVPVLLLAFYFEPLIVGWYSLSHTVLKLPMTFIGSSIGQVFFQHLSEFKEDKKKVAETTFSIYKKLFLLGIFPMAIIGGYGDVIFRIFLGEPWETAGVYAQILSPWLLFVFVVSPISNILNVLEKQKFNFIFNVLILIFRILAILVGGIIFQDALITILLFGGVSFVFWVYFAVRILKLSGVEYKKSILFTFPLILIITFLIVLLRNLTNTLL